MQFHGTPHWQFEKSPHHQRVVGDPPPCTQGYKSVHAWKGWHGRFGFNECDGFGFYDYDENCACTREEPHLTAPSTKYLYLRRELTFRRVDTVLDPPSTYTEDIHILKEAEVGRYTGENVLISSDREFKIDDVVQDWDAIVGGGGVLGALLARMTNYFNVNAVCGEFVGAVAAMPPGTGENWNIDDGLYYEFVTKTITADSITVVMHLLNTDELGNTQEYDLTVTVNLGSTYTSGQVKQDIVDLLAVWDLGDDTHYPWRVNSPPGASCKQGALVNFDEAFSAVSPESEPTSEGFTGTVIGGPVDGETWEDGPVSFFDQFDGLGFDSGAFIINGYFNDGEWTGSGICWAAKWAETKVEYPGHNFARPCGADATAVDCDDVLRWPDAPACEGDCNSTVSKGWFTWLTWTYTYRENGEYTRILAQNSACGEGCQFTVPTPPDLETMACGERKAREFTAIYCSPNSESFRCRATLIDGWGSGFVMDERYGGRWQCKVKQWMYDPLFLQCSIEDVIPKEESRCDVPAGCPPIDGFPYVYSPSDEQLDCPPIDVYSA